MLVSCFFHPVTIIQSSNAAAGPFFITKSTFSHGCCRDGLFLRGPESDHCHNPHSHGLNLIGAGLLPVGPSRPVLGVLARNPLRLSAVGTRRRCWLRKLSVARLSQGTKWSNKRKYYPEKPVDIRFMTPAMNASIPLA